MARSLKSFPESERKAKAMFRLENCEGLSKCGAMDYFRAIYAPVAKAIEKIDEALETMAENVREEEVGYSSYSL